MCLLFFVIQRKGSGEPPTAPRRRSKEAVTAMAALVSPWRVGDIVHDAVEPRPPAGGDIALKAVAVAVATAADE